MENAANELQTRYLALNKKFLTALELGKPASELAEIRKEIKALEVLMNNHEKNKIS